MSTFLPPPCSLFSVITRLSPVLFRLAEPCSSLLDPQLRPGCRPFFIQTLQLCFQIKTIGEHLGAQLLIVKCDLILDRLEVITAAEYWPMPVYSELLFSV